MRASSGFGPGAPWAIQSTIVVHSGEPTLNRSPPLCGTAFVGFKQKQRARGIGRRDPAAQGAARQREEVAFVVVTAERKLEAALARRRAVASAERAAGLREDRLHVIAKADG